MVVKSKKKRWSGPSGLVNPASTKHRENAKVLAGRSVGRGRKKKGAALTAGALAAHDAHMGTTDSLLDVETKTIAETVLGEIPEHELMDSVFAPIRRLWNSQMESHLETCAVFAAVDESIKAQELRETPTAYWAALMSTLESSEDRSSTTAVLFLLSLVTKVVPSAVLAKQYDSAMTLYRGFLSKYAHDPLAKSLLKSLLQCVRSQFRASAPNNWAADSVSVLLFKDILALTVDPRPKVRRAAQHAVAKAVELNSMRKKSPVQKSMSDFLQACLAQSDRSLHVETSYGLSLLSAIIPFLLPKTIAKLSEQLSVLMKQGNAILSVTCLDIYTALFEAQVNKTLPVALISSSLEEVIARQPAAVDVKPLTHWHNAVARGAHALTKMDAFTGAKALSEATTLLTQAYQSANKALFTSTTDAFKVLMEGVQLLVEGEHAHSTQVHSCLEEIASRVEECLSYRFQAAYHHVLTMIRELVRIVNGRVYSGLFDALIVSLAQLHETPNIKCKGAINDTLRSCVASVGPEHFLALLPLGIDTKDFQSEFPNGWVLPLLKDSFENASIGYFAAEILPLATAVEGLFLRAAEQNMQLHLMPYKQLFIQLWETLPGFLNNPSDPAMFSTIGETLIGQLKQSTPIRVIVTQALRTLASTQPDAIDDKVARTIMKVLMTAYISEADADAREPLLLTLKAFVTFVPVKSTATYFRAAFKKFIEANKSDPDRACRVLDVMIVFIPHVTEAELELLIDPSTVAAGSFQGSHSDAAAAEGENVEETGDAEAPAVSGVLNSGGFALMLGEGADERVQKRGYRALLAICSSETEAAHAFFITNLHAFQHLMVQTITTSRPATKALRLKCLFNIISETPPSLLEAFFEAIVVEVIMCCKEVNDRTRSLAYDVITLMAETVIDAEQVEECEMDLTKLFQLISSGLIGTTPHMLSATILCLSRLVFEVKEDASAAVLAEVIEMTLMLLSSPSREVQKSVLGFVKMLFSVLTTHELSGFMGTILDALFKMKSEDRHHYRSKIKIILERFIRKFGADAVAKHVPENDQKLLTAIRKARNYQKNKRMRRKQEQIEMQKQQQQQGGRNEDHRSKRSAARKNYNHSDDEDASDDDARGHKGARGGQKNKKKGHSRDERGLRKRGGLSFDDVIGSDGELASDDDDDDAAFKRSFKNKDKKATAAVAKSSRVKAFLRDDVFDESPLNLMDDSVVANISSVKPKKRGSGKRKKDDGDIHNLVDGRMVVEDLEELHQGVKGRSSARTFLASATGKQRGHVRGEGNDGGDGGDGDGDGADGEESAEGGITFGRGIHRDRRPTKKSMDELVRDDDDDSDGELSRKRTKKHAVSSSSSSATSGSGRGKKGQNALGSRFTSKKASGDMRRKGDAMMPFAYVPMDHTMMNRRQKAKAEKSFKNIVKGARKGAAQGRKSSQKGRK